MKKIYWLILATLVIAAATITSALAVSVDADDSFNLYAGESVEGSFIITEFSSVDNVEAKSSMRWLSFSDEKYVDVISSDGYMITGDSLWLPYFISIPDDAEIGVYRTVIVVTDGSEVEYLNVKISVQKKPVVVLLDFFSSLSLWYYIGFLILLSSSVVIWTFYDN